MEGDGARKGFVTLLVYRSVLSAFDSEPDIH